MSDSAKEPGGGATVGGVPLQIIVKGGTTSSAYDKARHEREEVAEQGREHLDKQDRAAAIGDAMTPDGFVSSRLHALRMLDRGSPRLVLFYMNKDGTVRQECTGEFVVLPDGDTAFTMVCPKCLERGESHGSAQVLVRQSNRPFTLDARRQGNLVQLLDPEGKPFHVKICGTIWCEQILRCMNFGCTWQVKIEDSKVIEV